MAVFELSKWYLDCVTASGDATIVYAGAVSWGPLRLHYQSLLESTGGHVASRHALRAVELPAFADGVLQFQAGAWRSTAQEIRTTIYSSVEGSIEWHCLMPRADAQVGGRTGLGYAERLIMTIAPWKLPIHTLRWGRFSSPSDWLVWIDWLGPFGRRLVYRNGEEASVTAITDDVIEFADGARVTMDRSMVLRDGPLGSTVLSVIPGVKDTFPARLLGIEECKWRSRARLEMPGWPASEGWAIHERVDWPQ